MNYKTKILIGVLVVGILIGGWWGLNSQKPLGNHATSLQNTKCDFSQNSESYESHAFSKYRYDVYDNYVMVSGSLMVGHDILIKGANLTAGDTFYIPSGEEQEVVVKLERIENNNAYFKFSFRAAPPACNDTVSCNYECDFVIEK